MVKSTQKFRFDPCRGFVATLTRIPRFLVFRGGTDLIFFFQLFTLLSTGGTCQFPGPNFTNSSRSEDQFVSSSRLRVPFEFAKTGQCDRYTVFALNFVCS